MKPYLPNILFEPIRTWSVEDRHQIRIYLRKLRLFIWLADKTELNPSESKRIQTLDKLSKDFLNSCGNIRDIDVLFELLNFYKIADPTVYKKLITRRALKIKFLNKQWPIKKRKILVNKINQFNTFIDSNNVISKKLLKITSDRLYRKLIVKKPQTKIEWHQFRRKLRRFTNLLDLQSKDKGKLIKLQKTLGALHDLENLKNYIKFDNYLKQHNKYLVKQANKYFFKLY